MIARVRRTAGALICVLAFVPALAAAQVSVQWPSERPPGPLQPRQIQFPPYEMQTLPNGLQVVAVAQHEQPSISIRLLVRAGSAQDPQNKGGVATLAASLLDQGTTSRSAEEIADQIDFIGGALGTGAGTDLTFVNSVVMKDSFEFGLELVLDVARNPAFAPEEIDRQKQQMVSSLQVSARDPDYIANSVFERLVYGFHPYGLPGDGTTDSIGAITRADLQDYHRRYFVPNNMILAVVGDVTPADAFAAVTKVFGGWARADVPSARPVDPPAPTRRIVVVDMPETVQTEIRVGMLAIPRKHPDYMAWDLAVKVLGGEGANRLHQVLRSQRGLTYGASADTEARKQAGHFVAETDTRTDTTAEALRLMVDEFARLQRDRVSSAELGGAQDYLVGSFPLSIETPNQIATQILNVLFYDLPISEIGTFRERALAVGPDDIQRVAREYVKPDRLTIVLVGNARAFVPRLTQMGFTGVEVIGVDDLDLMSATLKKESQRRAGAGAVSVPSAATVAASRRTAYTEQSAQGGAARPATPGRVGATPEAGTAAALLRRVITVKGGLAALKRVQTVVADSQTTFRMGQGPLFSTTRTYVVYPDKFRVDAKVSGSDVVQVYNSGSAWVKDPTGVHDASTAMRNDFAASVQRDIIPLLIAAAEGHAEVRLLPDQAIESTTFKVLEVTGARLAPVRLFVNDQMLVARQAYNTAGPDGRLVQADELFSDYQTIDGIRIPFKAVVLRGGQPILERTLTRVVINGPIDAKLFERPAQ